MCDQVVTQKMNFLPPDFIRPIMIMLTFLVMVFFAAILVPLPTIAATDGFATDGEEWPGFWFTCEFAQRQRPPDDECKMFDDEGFQLADGRLRYIRMIDQRKSLPQQ